MLKQITDSPTSLEPSLNGQAGTLAGAGQVEQASSAARRFQLVLIKPSHYGDDGYVIRWWRAMIPSNSLAAVYGIALECIERQVLGSGVNIDLEAIDEFSRRIELPKLVQRFRQQFWFGGPARG